MTKLCFLQATKEFFIIQVMSFDLNTDSIDAGCCGWMHVSYQIHYIPELRPLTADDLYIRHESQPEAKTFYHKLMDSLTSQFQATKRGKI